jgi:hypothetical protein
MRCDAVPLLYLGAGHIAMLAVLMTACSLLELFSFIVVIFKHGLRAANCDATQRSAALRITIAITIAIALRQHF